MRRLLPLLFLFASLLCYFPYLSAGFSADDYIFLSKLEGALPHDPWRGLWSGSMEEYPGFRSLWWMDPGVQGEFLRPVPSWVMAGLFRIFGRNPVPFHLLNLLGHGLAAWAGFLLLRRLSGRPALSLAAALLFLISDDHGMTVGWITTMTDVLCGLFLFLGLGMHVKARQEGRRAGVFLGAALGLLAMLSKETAVCYPLLVAAFEWIWRPTGPGRLRKDSWAWAAPAAVFAAYLVFYRSLVPAMQSLMYQDPFADPLRYLGMMAGNLPIMILGVLSPFMPSLAVFMPELKDAAIRVGVVFAVLFLLALRNGLRPRPGGGETQTRDARALRFCLAAFVLALLPGLAAEAGERILYIPSLFAFFPAAWLVFHIRPLRRRYLPEAARLPSLLGPAVAWSMVLLLVLAPLVLLFIYPAMWIDGMRLPTRTVAESLELLDKDNPPRILYLNTNSSYNTFYLPDIFRYHLGLYPEVYPLSSFHGKVWARQDSTGAVSLRSDRPGWLGSMFARIVRLEPVLEEGRAYETPAFRAVLVKLTEDRRDALEVRFELRRPLGDEGTVLLCHDGIRYRIWDPSPDWTPLNREPEGFGF